MKPTIKIGSAFDSSLNIHVSWLWLLPLSILTLVWLEIEPLLEAIVTTFLLLSSVMLMVLAQIWAARQSGLTWHNVTLFIVGGIVQRDTRSTPLQAFKITAAGHLVNILLTVVFGALWWLLPVGALGIEMEIVALFNLGLLILSLVVRLTPNSDNMLHAALASVMSEAWSHYIVKFINSAALAIFCVVGLMLLSFNWIGFGWWFAIALMLSQMTTIADLYGEYDIDKPLAQTDSAIEIGSVSAQKAR